MHLQIENYVILSIIHLCFIALINNNIIPLLETCFINLEISDQGFQERKISV